MKKVLFIFDRVAHYHRELFRTLEKSLPEQGMELHLLSGATPESAKGRIGLKETIVQNERKFQFREYQVSTYTLRRAEGVQEHIRELRPDLVLCIGHVGNATHWKLTQLKKQLGFKLLAWQCGYEYNPGKAKAFLLRRFVPRFDHHLAYHSNARDYALTHGARPDQVTLMHNTINEARIELLPKSVARELLVQRHPEIGSRKILLFVGAVLEEKRIEVILSALDILRRQDVVFVLVGDGDHLPAIRAASAGRTDVVITGSIVEGVGPYFDAAEVYLLPGTGGLGINEAMAHSLPIISGFADGSADDLVVDGENGYRLRDGTPEEMADRIAKILDQPEVAERMGKKSREWITGKFAFKEFIGRIKATLLAVA
ncbi:MAG: glycosyltransferase family 4 protein [Azonexus sp.]|nr:glycosyltransferase family 4 protein [Azonexus sp.]